MNHRQLRFLKRRPSAHLQQLLIPTLVEVAEGSAPEQREPAAAPMLRPVPGAALCKTRPAGTRHCFAASIRAGPVVKRSFKALKK